MIRIALLALVLTTGCNDKRPEERKLPGSAAPTTGTPGTGGTGGSAAPGTGGAGGAAGAGSAGGSAAGSAGGSTGGPAGGSAGGSTGGSAAAGPKATGFAPFDEAIAGTRPWVAADDKAGVVELFAVEDLSGQTPGKFSVERRCGADAAKAVESVGKQIPARLNTTPTREQPACKAEGAITRCVQPGVAEGDVVLEIEYGKAGDAWRVNGVKTYGVGMTFQKEADRYAALLKEKCK